jgi:hypothetical protein
MRELSEAQAGRLAAAHREQMERFGYMTPRLRKLVEAYLREATDSA